MTQERVGDIEQDLVDLLAELRRVDSSVLPVDVNFTQLGGDSLTGVLFMRRVNQRYDTNIPPVTLLQRDFSLSEFARYLVDNVPDDRKVISDWPAEVEEVWRDHCTFLHGDKEERKEQEHQGSMIFITGATGFLGKHVLMELLSSSALNDKQFLCLVRGKDEAEGRRRIQQALLEAMCPPRSSVEVDQLLARVDIAVGSGEKRYFGLPEERFNSLCADVHSVYHIASNTNTLLDYHALKASNVLSTVEAMRVASAAGLPSLRFSYLN